MSDNTLELSGEGAMTFLARLRMTEVRHEWRPGEGSNVLNLYVGSEDTGTRLVLRGGANLMMGWSIYIKGGIDFGSDK